jgi:hypothetical protein
MASNPLIQQAPLPAPRPVRRSCVLVLASSALVASCSFSLSVDWDDGSRKTTIYADRGWQDTGVSVRAGDELTVEVTSAKWFEDPPGVWHDAAGGPDPWICGDPDCHEPLPMEPKYALIGKIGEGGAPFLVSDFSRFFAESSGRLFLRANYGDEDIPIHKPTGSVQVTIRYK